MENIVEKAENAAYQNLLPFPQCFQKGFSSVSFNVMIVWLRVKSAQYKKLRIFKISLVFEDFSFKCGLVHYSEIGNA